jgi:hypothetical protein
MVLRIAMALSAFSFPVFADDPAKTTSQPSSPLIKLLERPDAFKTLVNPDCSHCVDEAKRRVGDLRDNDPVLAWIRGKYDGGAIPVRFFLAPYRVISDTYGVFVFDPDAGFMRGFEPSLDFRFHGWRNGVMVMRHKDGTLYSSLSGRAFDGPRKGDQLKPVPTLESNWGDWLDRYPDTVAYHMFDKYQPVEVPRDEQADSVATRGPADPRLPVKAEVLGVSIDGASRAYPLDVLKKSGGVIVDTLAGRKVYVLWYEPTRTAAIYAAEIDGADGKTTVTLAPDSQVATTPFIDRETDSRWDIAGRALAGPLKGKTLRWLPGIQCRWFAWAAEYPETEVFSKTAAANNPPARPFEGVIVEAAQVTSDSAAAWAKAGHRAVVVILDEQTPAAAYQAVARTVSDARLDLYYWIEVARNKSLADAHPRWMASLGMHGDWQKRFPRLRLPEKDKEVAKAYPWVPIGYREAFDAHLARIKNLAGRAAEPYRGMLLNDVQGGPGSCGCGNLQCRWALDYGVKATAEKLSGDDVAVRFIASVEKLIPNKTVVPIWMTECEHADLPSPLRAGALSTGLCGSVTCATGTCPKAFTRQWSPLVSQTDAPVGLFLLHKELERTGPHYSKTLWIPAAIEYIQTIPAGQGGALLPADRLWLVVQGYDISSEDQTSQHAAALHARPAALLTALVRLDQSYEPRIIPLE